MERVLNVLGAVAATAALICSFAFLFHVLDQGGGGGSPAATVIQIQVPGGRTGSGRETKPGHASVGSRAPRPEAVREGRSQAGSSIPGTEPPTLSERPRRGPAFEVAHVREGSRVDLQSYPNGPVVASVGDRTEFGSPTSFSVVQTRPGWLGVTSPEMNDDELGWIARDPSRLAVYWTRYSLRVHLDARSLELRYGDRVVGRWSVSVGGAGTETPPGRYGVTDGVVFDESPYYGCCALALSGHQTHRLPADWIGGNRLAIHGTLGTVGNAESLGCVRATDETMRFLFRRIPLGTPVFITD